MCVCSQQLYWLKKRRAYILSRINSVFKTSSQKQHGSQQMCCLEYRFLPSSLIFVVQYIYNQVQTVSKKVVHVLQLRPYNLP